MSRVALTGTGRHTSAPGTLPYLPSWVDRLVDWVDRLPWHGWWFYITLWLLTYLLESAVHWYDGIYPAGSFNLFHAVVCATPFYFLFLLHALDRVASGVLQDFKQVMSNADEEYSLLLYRITTLPALPALLAGILGVLLALPAFIFTLDYQHKNLTSLTPLTTAASSAVFLLVWWVGGVFIYHTVRQLRLVNTIYTQSTRINLFQLDPLFSFSTLTAFTAIGWGISNYAWMATSTSALENGFTLLVSFLMETTGIVTFVWPLYGLHRLLVREKRQRQIAVGLQMDKAMRELDHVLATNELGRVTQIKDMLTGIDIELRVISNIPTWPWRPDTIRLVLSAVLFPAVIYSVQRIFARFFGV